MSYSNKANLVLTDRETADRLFSCCKLFMNTKYLSQEIMDHLIQTISSRSVSDCKYRLWEDIYFSNVVIHILTIYCLCKYRVGQA
jgi:hypothetical protein